jgi:hypothetical protein
MDVRDERAHARFDEPIAHGPRRFHPVATALPRSADDPCDIGDVGAFSAHGRSRRTKRGFVTTPENTSDIERFAAERVSLRV